jgi:Uma2 family endonuclease
MAEPASKRATWADLEALPEHVRGELIFGVLYTHAQPRPRHQRIAGLVFARTSGPYDHDPSGPGGWWILVEPGIGLPELDVGEVVPDVAGWRRERLPGLPDTQIQLAPDWVCEVLSPSTRTHDLRLKRKLYADAGVRWMWVVDPEARTLTASRLHVDGDTRRWLELGVYADDDVARVEPFDELELRCVELWG